MKKILLSITAGAVIGFVIAAFLFSQIPLRSSPEEPMKVVENPTEQQKKKADIVFTEKIEGKVGSRVPVEPVEIAESVRQYELLNLPNLSVPEESNKKTLTLEVGQVFSAPATGKIRTIYIDQVGREIGEGVHQLQGETEVKVGSEWLDISTNFQELVTVAVDVPEQSQKSFFNVYAGLKLDTQTIKPIIGIGYFKPIWGNFYWSFAAEYETLNWNGEYKLLGHYRFN